MVMILNSQVFKIQDNIFEIRHGIFKIQRGAANLDRGACKAQRHQLQLAYTFCHGYLPLTPLNRFIYEEKKHRYGHKGSLKYSETSRPEHLCI